MRKIIIAGLLIIGLLFVWYISDHLFEKSVLNGVWKMSSDFCSDSGIMFAMLTIQGSGAYLFSPGLWDQKMTFNTSIIGSTLNTDFVDWDGSTIIINKLTPQITIIDSDGVMLAHFVKDIEGTIISQMTTDE